MIQILRQIGAWVGTGPLAPIAMALGILTTIAALAIVLLELSGRTITLHGIEKNNYNWDWKGGIVLVATAALVILLSPIHLDFIKVLQQGPRVSPALAPVLAVVFGLPAVFGYMLGVFISSLQSSSGITALAVFNAVWGALAWVWITWLPYRAIGKLDFSNASASLGTVGRFYLWGVVIGPFFHLWASPILSILQGGQPAAVWGRMLPMIAINHDLPFIIIGPIALAILYPLAKFGHLFWWDRERAAAATAS